jgi:hypothetical protein
MADKDATLSSGPILGRVMMLETATQHLKGLFETIYLGVNEEQLCDKDSQEETVLLFVVQAGRAVCDRIDKELERLRQMAYGNMKKEAAAKKEG